MRTNLLFPALSTLIALSTGCADSDSDMQMPEGHPRCLQGIQGQTIAEAASSESGLTCPPSRDPLYTQSCVYLYSTEVRCTAASLQRAVSICSSAHQSATLNCSNCLSSDFGYRGKSERFGITVDKNADSTKWKATYNGKSCDQTKFSTLEECFNALVPVVEVDCRWESRSGDTCQDECKAPSSASEM